MATENGLSFEYDDGGRSKYFKAENVSDCVTRAISIALGLDYKEVYDEINTIAKKERKGSRKRGKSRSREGVYKNTYKKFLASRGWEFVPTMKIGEGCRMHFTADEIPSGTIILKLSRHLVCVKDKVIHDTYDSSVKEYLDDTTQELIVNTHRCVYGYFRRPEAS